MKRLLISAGFDTPKLASAWIELVRRAAASRVLVPTFRWEWFDWFEREPHSLPAP